MKKSTVITLIIVVIVILAAGAYFFFYKNQTGASCNSGCVEQGFVSGACEWLGVRPEPCETAFGKTTIYTTGKWGYCGKEYKASPEKKNITGVGYACCCGK